ncbi:SRPBCC family protein [Paenibacillus arenilitoris]|uniref:SRPBCC family protein n=1 Tax=Paenibacillus arenilitoris TaxID=2772299 RepID=A0A927CJU0_9BACL|nr:SRPBCC family protein [Paenibacillus arenilitoris]MBD2867501.1 SRPBCC family protein [Paenibacillus arenilitoris]
MTENDAANNENSATDKFEFVSTRVLNASPALVYEAWTNPEHLAQWWGPDGFTNTFREFDLRPGGIWEFVMHGPNGADYANKSEFVEIGPERIVLRHLSAPHFQLTAIFEDDGGKTRLTWRQLFEEAAVFNAIKKIAAPANEQNLDRLEAQLRKMAV